MYKNDRLLITQSLLSSWLYLHKGQDSDPKKQFDDFLKVLNRKPTKKNQAMQNGILFEDMVTDYCHGKNVSPGHEWADGVQGVGKIVKGSQFQVVAIKETEIGGIPFLLYGRLDALHNGTIYDIKFSKSYESGKYLDSPQHPMYMACIPNARRFQYVIYTGKDVCTETYYREQIQDIEVLISWFIQFLKDTDLYAVYADKWRALK